GIMLRVRAARGIEMLRGRPAVLLGAGGRERVEPELSESELDAPVARIELLGLSRLGEGLLRLSGDSIHLRKADEVLDRRIRRRERARLLQGFACPSRFRLLVKLESVARCRISAASVLRPLERLGPVPDLRPKPDDLERKRLVRIRLVAIQALLELALLGFEKEHGGPVYSALPISSEIDSLALDSRPKLPGASARPDPDYPRSDRLNELALIWSRRRIGWLRRLRKRGAENTSCEERRTRVESSSLRINREGTRR